MKNSNSTSAEENRWHLQAEEPPIDTVQKSKGPLYISLGLVAALVGSYFLVPGVQEFFKEAWEVLTSDNEARIQAWVGQFGWLGPLVIIIAMVLQMFLLVIPTPLLMVVSVLAFGPVWGTLIILAAVFCASSIGYMIGAYLGPPVVGKLLGKKGQRTVEGFIDDYGFWAILVTRLAPFLSNDAISFVAGMLRMGYWRFIGATLLGITPLAILIAWLGQENDRLKSGLIWVSVISFIGFVGYVWWDRRRKKRISNRINPSH
ncbi:TVP38/TMEM64 family protein [Cesiribacter andamanensis]|uniref:TVP38/TMEM64 family membrane protein n=1 Tax=Cesiribacter andamanensis AMV16 TaxID=1279009 RepID=M7N5H6_9BACT|nr:TVP38/TMEM64 family protein [Cesiribacter andamanensis]EMR03873.1 TVP38/TMEM64 family inner membrane protein ydjZ [Cesiribacter andamanensis AMV16]